MGLVINNLEKSELKAIIREVIQEDPSMFKAIIKEVLLENILHDNTNSSNSIISEEKLERRRQIFEEQNDVKKTLQIIEVLKKKGETYQRNLDRKEHVERIIKNDFKKYDDVFKALA